MKTLLFYPLLLVITLCLLASCQSEEDKDWEATQSRYSAGAIDSFLQRYPDSKYKDNAKAIEQEINWLMAERTNTIYSYKKYISDYPTGQYQSAVEDKLNTLVNEEINLADLTKGSFSGKINYTDIETQILYFKFVEIQEEDNNIRFVAEINTSNIRKSIEGRINKTDYSIMFMEDPDQKEMLNLTDGKIYFRGNKLMIESTNISQYWRLLKYQD